LLVFKLFNVLKVEIWREHVDYIRVARIGSSGYGDVCCLLVTCFAYSPIMMTIQRSPLGLHGITSQNVALHGNEDLGFMKGGTFLN
jgi:hypothetical protein